QGTLYRNGVIVAQQNVGTFLQVSTYYGLYLGGRRLNQFSQSVAFKGLIDEPAIYSRALSQSENHTIYKPRTAGKHSTNNPKPQHTPPGGHYIPTYQPDGAGRPDRHVQRDSFRFS